MRDDTPEGQRPALGHPPTARRSSDQNKPDPSRATSEPAGDQSNTNDDLEKVNKTQASEKPAKIQMSNRATRSTRNPNPNYVT